MRDMSVSRHCSKPFLWALYQTDVLNPQRPTHLVRQLTTEEPVHSRRPSLPSDHHIYFLTHLFSFLFFKSKTPPVGPWVTSADLTGLLSLLRSFLTFLSVLQPGNSVKCKVLLLAAAWGSAAKNREELRTHTDFWDVTQRLRSIVSVVSVTTC